MALSDDQKAMLRLLAQREEGYKDMAALMGISVGEVRERVKEALAEGGAGPRTRRRRAAAGSRRPLPHRQRQSHRPPQSNRPRPSGRASRPPSPRPSPQRRRPAAGDRQSR